MSTRRSSLTLLCAALTTASGCADDGGDPSADASGTDGSGAATVTAADGGQTAGADATGADAGDDASGGDDGDWPEVECGHPDTQPDGTLSDVDKGMAAWDKDVAVNGDGHWQTSFGTLYPVRGSDDDPIPLGADGGIAGSEWMLRRLNWFRSLEGLEPYVRFVQDEPCAAGEAYTALVADAGHVLECGGYSQNACGGDGEIVIGGNWCLQLSWTEAQTQGGHYGAMMRTEPRYSATGYYGFDADGSAVRPHRLLQDFYNHKTRQRLDGAEPELFASADPPAPGSLVATDVAVGGNHSCALINDGSVRCWGDSWWGQTGDGLTQAARASVGPAVDLPGPATQVVAGQVHTCALLEDGGIRCWGSHEYGQLGMDDFNGQIREWAYHWTGTPTAPINLPENDPAVFLSAAHSSTCARLQSGAVYCWGYSLNGVLGHAEEGDNWSDDGEVVGPESTAFRDAETIALGTAHGCMLREGGAQCWGRDFRGQVGDGERETQYFKQEGTLEPHDVVGLDSGVAQIETGAEHTCAVHTNGVVSCWGSNRYGQLGFDGGYDPPDETHVVEWLDEPRELCLERPTTDLALGGAHSCALLNDGTVQCWGSANHGKLGNGNYVTDSVTPVAVVAVDGFSDVVSIDSQYMHTCAVTGSGQVYCWGLNYWGQLGDGTTTDQAEPVLVVGF